MAGLMPDQLAGWVATAVAAVAVVELFMAVPLLSTARAMSSSLHKSLNVLRAPGISDHWKEKALRAYAFSSMGSSLALLAMFIGLFIVCGLAFHFTGSLLQPGFDSAAAALELRYVAGMIVMSALYWLLRRRFLHV